MQLFQRHVNRSTIFKLVATLAIGLLTASNCGGTPGPAITSFTVEPELLCNVPNTVEIRWGVTNSDTRTLGAEPATVLADHAVAETGLETAAVSGNTSFTLRASRAGAGEVNDTKRVRVVSGFLDWPLDAAIRCSESGDVEWEPIVIPASIAEAGLQVVSVTNSSGTPITVSGPNGSYTFPSSSGTTSSLNGSFPGMWRLHSPRNGRCDVISGSGGYIVPEPPPGGPGIPLPPNLSIVLTLACG